GRSGVGRHDRRADRTRPRHLDRTRAPGTRDASAPRSRRTDGCRRFLMTIVNSTDDATASRGPVRKRLSQLAYVLASCAIAACASAPPAPPPPPGPPFAQKMSWILRFEDQRILRDPVPVAPPPAPPAAPPPRGKKAAVVIPPPPPPDLIRLLSDRERRLP